MHQDRKLLLLDIVKDAERRTRVISDCVDEREKAAAALRMVADERYGLEMCRKIARNVLREMDEDAPEEPPRRPTAREWLEERFREKRWWYSADLQARAKEDGVSWEVLWEAAVDLPFHRYRESRLINGNCESAWVWKVLDGWPAAKKEGTTDATNP